MTPVYRETTLPFTREAVPHVYRFKIRDLDSRSFNQSSIQDKERSPPSQEDKPVPSVGGL